MENFIFCAGIITVRVFSSILFPSGIVSKNRALKITKQSFENVVSGETRIYSGMFQMKKELFIVRVTEGVEKKMPLALSI